MTGPRVILVAGSPRSGTTALFDLLSADPRVVSYHEPDGRTGAPVPDDPVYVGERLRPEPQLRDLLAAAPGPVLLRGNEELPGRTLDDIDREFEAYDLTIVWIYRDAAKVLGSAVARGWWEPTPERLAHAIDDWNQRNRLALEAVTDRLEVVSYSDLTTDKTLVGVLAGHLGLRVPGGFGADQARGLAALPPGAADEIGRQTGATLTALDARRTVRPGSAPPVPAPASAPRASVTYPGPDQVVTTGPRPTVPARDPAAIAGLRLSVAEPIAPVEPGAPIEVAADDDLDFVLTRDWTMVVGLELPTEKVAGWSPIVTVGAPIQGEPGVGLAWLGPDTDERPTPGPGEDDVIRRPGTSLLIVGITGRRAAHTTSATQIGLAVKQTVDPRTDRHVVVVARHRGVAGGDRRELELAVGRRPVTVRADPPPVPEGHRVAGGLLVGGHPAAPGIGFAGTVTGLVLYDRDLDDDETAALVAHFGRPRTALVDTPSD